MYSSIFTRVNLKFYKGELFHNLISKTATTKCRKNSKSKHWVTRVL